MPAQTREHERMAGLQNDRDGWRRFGPYVSERAWGTVREDYSPNGDAWAYFPHDLAASKAYRSGEDGLVVKVTAGNRGPEAAPLHLLPHLWFRNTWAWSGQAMAEPIVRAGTPGPGHLCIVADDRTAEPIKGLSIIYRLGARHLYMDDGGRLLFTYNETNAPRVWGPGAKSRRPYVKDAFHRHVIHGEDAVNPDEVGTKACGDFRYLVPAGASVTLRLRLTPDRLEEPLADVDRIVAEQKAQADEFYAAIQP